MRDWRLASVLYRVVAAIAFLALCRPEPLYAREATPAATAPMVVASEVLGHAKPVPIENPELSIARVAIMPGAAIPPHHHTGTQFGIVIQRTLIYTVFTASVDSYFKH